MSTTTLWLGMTYLYRAACIKLPQTSWVCFSETNFESKVISYFRTLCPNRCNFQSVITLSRVVYWLSDASTYTAALFFFCFFLFKRRFPLGEQGINQNNKKHTTLIYTIKNHHLLYNYRLKNLVSCQWSHNTSRYDISPAFSIMTP